MRIFPVGFPNIGSRKKFFSRVRKMFGENILTNNGPLVREFEERIADMAGTKYAIAVSNASLALTLVAKCLELRGEVVLPSYTFVATPHSMLMAGLKPIFADIDPSTHNICLRSTAKLINRNTAAIIGVHLWGRPCDIFELEKLAEKHTIPLFFDAAHAFGASLNGRKIGSFGTCEVFSFHATKFLNSFEGGAITTNSGDLAEKLRLARNFGFSGVDKVTSWGTNAKMPEICAAIGLTNLESMSKFVDVNRKNYEYAKRIFSNSNRVKLLEFNESNSPNYQYLVVELTSADAHNDRERLISELHRNGYIVRRYFWPSCHKMEPYRDDLSHTPIFLKNTELVADRVMVLPTGKQIKKHNLDEIAGILNY
jgi:dTDP-4-amino-4,6-dideoxygalactose transaminase